MLNYSETPNQFNRTASKSESNCSDCRLAGICLPISLEVSDIDKLDNIVKRGRPVHKKEHVYRAGTAFKSVYAVRSGAIKTIKTMPDGAEQITGFHLPGELIGIDGLASNIHSNSAIALETSAVCEIPFHRFEELSAKIPSLQRRFIQLMGQEIEEEQQLVMMLSKKSAEERLSALLLNISERHKGRGLSPSEFYLPMSRSDIGNYLGLTIETVSRVFSRLAKNKVIELDKKHITILNLNALSNPE